MSCAARWQAWLCKEIGGNEGCCRGITLSFCEPGARCITLLTLSCLLCKGEPQDTACLKGGEWGP